MPLDHSHQHISSDIMQVDSPQAPISPSGGSGLPQGGLTGQALVKASDDDGDAEWAARVANPATDTLDMDGNGLTNLGTSYGLSSSDLTLRGGEGPVGQSGRHLILAGGTADDGGGNDGGTIELRGGTMTDPGLIVLNDLPTSDPAVAGALWLDSGVLSVSAGGPS